MFTKAFRSVSVSKKIALLALFIAVSVLANSVLGVDIGGMHKIAFTYLVCFFAGCFMGPVPAFIVGVVGDAIGFLIQPSEVFWFFGVTLGLFGFLSGLIMNGIRTKTTKGLYAKALLTFIVGFLVITCIVNSVVQLLLYVSVLLGRRVQKGFLDLSRRQAGPAVGRLCRRTSSCPCSFSRRFIKFLFCAAKNNGR